MMLGRDEQQSIIPMKKKWAIGLGFLAAILAAAWITSEINAIIPRYESTFHRSSIKLATELLMSGNTNRVLEAFAEYNDTAASDTTYRAAMQMWMTLNHGKRKEPQPSAGPYGSPAAGSPSGQP
jgi:hypothetical protein